MTQSFGQRDSGIFLRPVHSSRAALNCVDTDIDPPISKSDLDGAGGAGTSWVDRSVQCDVFDFAARDPDVAQLPVVEVIQGGTCLCWSSSLLKRRPTCFEEPEDLQRRCEGLSQFGRTHCCTS